MDDGPTVAPRPELDVPSSDDQFYRIAGTTAGGTLFGGAVGSALGGAVIVGAIIGSLVGLGISSWAAARVPSHQRT
jgi:outer membrane lipoprotein SlyB